MTDLVERLRIAATHELVSDDIALEAADEIEALRARIAILERDGPQIERGHNDAGTVRMGSMRSVMEDYKRAAEVEAKLGDEARARVAALEKAILAIDAAMKD